MTRILRLASALGLVAAVAFLGLTLNAQSGTPFRPVTDEMLRRPAADDWLWWRGASQSLGYSTLNQINKDNVNQLQLAWSWNMEPGVQEPAMIVHDGIMYIPNPGGIVQALDGATGDMLWEYRPAGSGPRSPSPLRGLSIWEDKIFVALPNARLVALDARTGKEVWNVAVGDEKKGFSFRIPPVVTRSGKLVTGLWGCTKFVEEKCGMVGHDAKTGKELWRISTIAKPGEKGGETWGDVPYLYRAGTEMWIGGSYDYDLNLVYLATSQAKPWTQMARGTDGDALYSNTLFAINPDTGKVEWFQQLVPGETTDFDEVFENLLVDVNGRKSVFKLGKLLILWEMDRKTGKRLNAIDLGIQNMVDIDKTTFVPHYRPGKIPKDQGNGTSQLVDICPGASAKTWPAMAYAPETQAFYMQHAMTCMMHDYKMVEKVPEGGGVGSGAFTNRIIDPKGNNGRLLAMTWDGKKLWEHLQRTSFTSSAITTAGGLVFIGDFDRNVKAFDFRTGKVLWQSRGPTGASGHPATYMAHGRQYVAMPFGTGASLASTRTTLSTPPGSITPEVKPGRVGNVLMVYALPQAH